MNLTIRKIQQSDVFDLLSLCDEGDHYRQPLEQLLSKVLCDEAYRESTTVALIDGRPVGLICAGVVFGDTLVVNFLYVSPAYRGQGIGRQLLETAERKFGCASSLVYYHKSLRGYYAKLGYKVGSELEMAIKNL